MNQFNRMLDPELINKLNDEKLFNEKLKHDIKIGEVFFTIRENKVDFYHKGGRVFTYDGKFKTHIKYASVGKMEEEKDYVSLEDLRSVKFCNFIEGYERIKENCAHYAGIEAEGVSRIYSRYSYVNKTSSIGVLDIEVSLGVKEGRNQDRIDLLLFNNDVLRFYEVKHFSNAGIWSRKDSQPRVVEQINRYKRQIKSKESRIIEQYRNYIDLINGIFQLDIIKPNKIDYEIPLLVFGFDRDQLKGRFQVLFQQNVKGFIKYYALGDISKLNIKNMWDECR